MYCKSLALGNNRLQHPLTTPTRETNPQHSLTTPHTAWSDKAPFEWRPLQRCFKLSFATSANSRTVFPSLLLLLPPLFIPLSSHLFIFLFFSFLFLSFLLFSFFCLSSFLYTHFFSSFLFSTSYLPVFLFFYNNFSPLSTIFSYYPTILSIFSFLSKLISLSFQILFHTHIFPPIIKFSFFHMFIF